MKLLNANEIQFDKVLEEYNNFHGSKNDWWELRNLKRANEKFGHWILCEIPSSEIKNVVLGQYQHEGCNVTPKEGSFLFDAHKNFIQNKEYFLKENNQFCKRFEIQKKLISKEGMRTIFLSEKPLFVGTTYSHLHKFKNNITHLDGFHRLMAFQDLYINKETKIKSIKCYIAVSKDFLRCLN